MIIFLRHGESEWNAPPSRCQGQLDVTLSDRGRRQAREVAARLDAPTVVFSSHLSRALETAQIITRETSTRSGHKEPMITIDERLCEANCGSWQGQLHRDIQSSEPALWRALKEESPGFAFPGGESLSQLRRRFCEALDEIRSTHDESTITLVVAHGGPIRLYLAQQRLLDRTAPGGPPGNLEGFRISEGELSLFTWS